MADKKTKKTLLETLGESQVWKSIIRSGVPPYQTSENARNSWECISAPSPC